MHKHLINIAKLLFVAALMSWVLMNVQWQDRVVVLDAQDEVVTETHGQIVKDWREDVRFIAEGQTEPRSLVADERVRPGLPTYWRNLEVDWFVLGALLYLFSVVFASTRWWWLLRVNNLPIGYWAALRFTWIGMFFNNVVPGQTGGDLVKAIYVMKRCHGERVPAMMSVVVDRIMGLASLSVLAAGVVLFYLDEFKDLALVLWGVLAGVVLLGMVAFSRRLRSIIRLKSLLERLPNVLSQLLKRIDHAVYFYRSRKGGMAFWLSAGVINHVASVLSYYCVGRALGVGVPLSEYFVLIPIIVIVSAVPIAPNGWGVGEFMFRTLFSQFATAPAGVSAMGMGTRGVALSLLYRIHLTAWSLVGGIMFFFDKDKVTRADMAREVASEEAEEADLDAEMEAADRLAESRAADAENLGNPETR